MSCARHIGTIPVSHWRHIWYYTRSNNCSNNIIHFLGYILNIFTLKRVKGVDRYGTGRHVLPIFGLGHHYECPSQVVFVCWLCAFYFTKTHILLTKRLQFWGTSSLRPPIRVLPLNSRLDSLLCPPPMDSIFQVYALHTDTVVEICLIKCQSK